MTTKNFIQRHLRHIAGSNVILSEETTQETSFQLVMYSMPTRYRLEA